MSSAKESLLLMIYTLMYVNISNRNNDF